MHIPSCLDDIYKKRKACDHTSLDVFLDGKSQPNYSLKKRETVFNPKKTSVTLVAAAIHETQLVHSFEPNFAKHPAVSRGACVTQADGRQMWGCHRGGGLAQRRLLRPGGGSSGVQLWLCC